MFDTIKKARNLAASALGEYRNSDWSKLRKPVLMFHAPSAQCDSAPLIEAKSQAARSRFTLVQVGYEKQEVRPNCGPNSQRNGLPSARMIPVAASEGQKVQRIELARNAESCSLLPLI